jgi:hypothetical protein
MSRLKGLVTVTDEEGKQVISTLRTIIGILATTLAGALVMWFAWVSTQAYEVATNKTLIRETATRLERDIGLNSQDIIMNAGEVEDKFNRVNKILHGRITKVDDKYDGKLTDLEKMLIQTNVLIVEMLIQKNKDVQLQKKEVKIQQEILEKK